MKHWKTLAIAGAACCAFALGGAALAQQPPPGQPGNPARPGQPIQILPRGPGQQPGRPTLGPDGRPVGPGGTPRPLPPGARPPGPGGRPGMPGMPGARPRPAPAPAPEPEEAHEHECKGHGHDDPPPPPNWWRGLLMVDNERAQSPNVVNQLLFRYENPKDPCDEKNQPPPFLASVLNFGVLAFIFYRYGRKPLATALLKRKEAIMAEIDTASSLQAAAEERLRDYEDKLERLTETLAELRAEQASQAEAEKKHVLAEAEERRERMRRDAEFRIEQELKTARAELLREAVLGAVVAAEELVAKRVASSDLDRLADDYLASVGPALSGKSAVASRGGEA